MKSALKNSVVNIVILSRDYYQSAYCLNEAGVLWYQDNIPVVPIALPEINYTNMYGFLNNEYKLRRLDCDTDISYIYDVVYEAASATPSKVSAVTYEMQKLKERYNKFMEEREPFVQEDALGTVEERISTFGDRWMAEGQIKNIKQWKSKNTLDSTLSDNYGACLELFKQHNLVYESSWTSHGNPREYQLCPSLQNLLFNKISTYSAELQRIKDEHVFDLPF